MNIQLSNSTQSEFETLARQIFVEDLVKFLTLEIFNQKVPQHLNLNLHVRAAIDRASSYGIGSQYGVATFVILELSGNRIFETTFDNQRSTLVGNNETHCLIDFYRLVCELKRASWSIEIEKRFISTLQLCHDRFAHLGDVGRWFLTQDPKKNFLTYVEAVELSVVGFPTQGQQTYLASSGTLCPLGDIMEVSNPPKSQKCPRQIWIPISPDEPSHIRLQARNDSSNCNQGGNVWISDESDVRQLDPSEPLVNQVQLNRLHKASWPDIKSITNLPTAIVLDWRAGLDKQNDTDADQLANSVHSIVRFYNNSQHLRLFEWTEWPIFEYRDDQLCKTNSFAAKFIHQRNNKEIVDPSNPEKAFESQVAEGLKNWFNGLADTHHVSNAKWISESTWLIGNFHIAYGLCNPGDPDRTPLYRIQTATKLEDSKVDFRWSALLEYSGSSAIIHLDCVAPLPFDLNSDFWFTIDDALKPELLPKQEFKIPIVASVEAIVQVGKPTIYMTNSIAGELEILFEMTFCQLTQRIVPRLSVAATSVTIEIFLKDGLLGDVQFTEQLSPQKNIFDWTIPS